MKSRRIEPFPFKILAGPLLCACMLIVFKWSLGLGLLPGIAAFSFDDWRTLQAIMLIIATVCATLLPNKYWHGINGAIVVLLFTLLFTSAALNAGNARANFLELSLWGLLFGATVAFRSIWIISPLIGGVISLALALSFVPMIFGIMFSVMGAITVGSDVDWHFPFSYVRYFNDWALAIFLLLWSLRGASSERASLRWAKFLISAVLVFSLLLDGARACVAAIMILLVVTSICGRGDLKRYRGLWLSVLTGTVAWSLLLLADYLSFLELPIKIARTSSSGRSELYLLAWRYIYDAPFFGIGGMNWGLYASESNIYEGLSAISWLAHPHNIALQWIAEWGAAGWLAAGLCLYSCIVIWSKRRAMEPVAVGGLAALVFNALLSGAAVYPHTQLIYAWFIAWVMFEGRSSVYAEPEKKHEGFIYALKCLLIILCVGQGVIWHGLLNKPNCDPGLPEKMLAPRYFQDGSTLSFHAGPFICERIPGYK